MTVVTCADRRARADRSSARSCGRSPPLFMSGGPTRAITSPSCMPGARNLRSAGLPPVRFSFGLRRCSGSSARGARAATMAPAACRAAGRAAAPRPSADPCRNRAIPCPRAHGRLLVHRTCRCRPRICRLVACAGSAASSASAQSAADERRRTRARKRWSSGTHRGVTIALSRSLPD